MPFDKTCQPERPDPRVMLEGHAIARIEAELGRAMTRDERKKLRDCLRDWEPPRA